MVDLSKAFLGIDVGSVSLNFVLIDIDGKVLSLILIKNMLMRS